MSLTLVVIAAVAGGVLLLVVAGARIIREYQRGVVFRLGRLSHLKRPGLRLVIPLIDRVVKVDLRSVHYEIPAQEVITEDNVLATVGAVIYLQVVNPLLAATKVLDYRSASRDLVQSSLRSALGQVTLAQLLTGRDSVNALLEGIINQELEAWGVALTNIEIKDLRLPETMLRALGREAEAELERKAQLVAAEGELATVRALADAAGEVGSSATLLQLRYLQTLAQIGNERSTVVVFPMPIDLVEPLLQLQSRTRAGTRPAATPASRPVLVADPPPPPPPPAA